MIDRLPELKALANRRTHLLRHEKLSHVPKLDDWGLGTQSPQGSVTCDSVSTTDEVSSVGGFSVYTDTYPSGVCTPMTKSATTGGSLDNTADDELSFTSSLSNTQSNLQSSDALHRHVEFYDLVGSDEDDDAVDDADVSNVSAGVVSDDHPKCVAVGDVSASVTQSTSAAADSSDNHFHSKLVASSNFSGVETPECDIDPTVTGHSDCIAMYEGKSTKCTTAFLHGIHSRTTKSFNDVMPSSHSIPNTLQHSAPTLSSSSSGVINSSLQMIINRGRAANNNVDFSGGSNRHTTKNFEYRNGRIAMGDFFDRVATIKCALHEISIRSDYVEHHALNLKNSKFTDTQDAIFEESGRHLHEAQELVMNSFKVLQVIDREIRESRAYKINPLASDVRVQVNIHQHQLRQLLTSTNTFHKAQSLLRRVMYDTTTAIIKSVYPEISEQDVERLIEIGDLTPQAALRSLHTSSWEDGRVVMTQLQEKYHRIRRLQKDSTELQAMFLQLQAMVNSQELNIDIIRQTTNLTAEKCKATVDHLTSAKGYQAKTVQHWYCTWITFICVALFVMISSLRNIQEIYSD